MSNDVMHQLRKRIDHIVATCGKAPNVLDVPPDDWQALLEEVGNVPMIHRGNPPAFRESAADWAARPPKQLELFGVRFVKGRHP